MRRAALAAFVALLTGACGAGVTQRGDPTPVPDLTVFAASSLKSAVERAAEAYVGSDKGPTIVVSTDSSAALEAQIEQGAPADVFLAADTTRPQKLVDDGFAAGDAVVFAGNRLTVIVPLDNPGGVEEAADLGEAGLRVIAAGDEVPITAYAVQLVDRLAALPGYPEDLAAAYAANVVSKEDNVKAVVAKVELGEGDAGIVYVTDAKASARVTRVPVPEEASVSATYAGIVVKASRNQVAAQAFLTWFAGARGQAILAELGFLPPPP